MTTTFNFILNKLCARS